MGEDEKGKKTKKKWSGGRRKDARKEGRRGVWEEEKGGERRTKRGVEELEEEEKSREKKGKGDWRKKKRARKEGGRGVGEEGKGEDRS